MKTQNLKTLRLLILLSVCLLIGMAVALQFRPDSVNSRLAIGDVLGGDFTLQSADGPVTLSDYNGNATLIYIGYASCPDVCPTSLAVMSQGMKQLSEDLQQKTKGIFISVDPERDTLENLKKYSAYFHPNIVGVTGEREAIDNVVRQYGAFYKIVEMESSAMGYAVDHSSRFYLVGKDGRLVEALAHNSTPADIQAAVEKVLN